MFDHGYRRFLPGDDVRLHLEIIKFARSNVREAGVVFRHVEHDQSELTASGPPETIGGQSTVARLTLPIPAVATPGLYRLGRTAFALAPLGRHHLTGIFQRALVWWSVTGLLWLAGGLAHGDLRVAIWVVAVLVEYGGVWLGFPVPGLGRSRTTDYTIAGEHMAERCRPIHCGPVTMPPGKEPQRGGG